MPDSVTVPAASAMLGTSGEVAAAVPIVHPVPEPVRHGTSAPTFGVIALPRPSVMVLLADSVAACVIPRSQLAALVLGVLDHRRGEQRGVGQPGAAGDVQRRGGALRGRALDESAVSVTFAAGLGQLVGSRSVVNERLSSLIDMLGRFENAMLSPTVGVLLSVTSAVLSASPGRALHERDPGDVAGARGLDQVQADRHRGAGAAVIVPLPTWHDAFGVDDSRQSAAGLVGVREQPARQGERDVLGGVAVELGENVASKPTVAGLVPAVVPVGSGQTQPPG